MALTDLLSSVVSRPAGRILESSVRTLVNDLIRDHDLASAAEVDTLRRSLRELEGRADELQAKLGSAEADVAQLRDALAKADQQLADANAAMAALENAAHSHAEAPAPEPEPAAPVAPEPPSSPEGCKVPGCTNKHRSKGFCSPHYQRWRRGTLPGYAMPDGSVTIDGKTKKLGKKLAGRAYEVVDGKAVLAD